MSSQDSSAGLLSGVKILDLSGVGPGARCARILADLGADVVRVVPPARPGSHRLEAPYHAYGGGRDWRRLVLDLKQQAGCEVFLQLAKAADVVVEGFRPGVAARLGVDYDAVRKVNPKIVYCSISGYGQTGPAANWVGHDLNYAALAGMLAMSGTRADGGPAIPGLTAADTAGGGMHAVISILAGLLRSRASGEGTYLDVSMTEGLLYLMSMHVDEYLATGREPGPGTTTLTGGAAYYDLYQAADGRWLSLTAVEAGFFANVCRVLGCEEWIAHQGDPDQQEAIRGAFRRAFASQPRSVWVERFAGVDSCIVPVSSVAELVEDPHFLARGAFIEVHHPTHGKFRQLGPLLAGSKAFAEDAALSAATAIQSASVLAEIGIQGEGLQRLIETGAVGV